MQITESEIVFILVAISSTILILSVFFLLLLTLFNKSSRRKQSELFMAVVDTQEKERQRIGKDLHDDIGPLLSAIKLNMERLQPRVKDNEIMAYVKDLLDDAVKGVRSSAHNLMPDVLQYYDLAAAIQDICNKVNNHGKLTIEFIHHIEGLNISQSATLNIYRILNEIINNTIKHADATTLNITLIKQKHLLVIGIKDNGVGFDTSLVQGTGMKSGIGLKNIESRVNLMNGKYDLKSEPGKGTKIKIILAERNLIN